MRPSAGGGGGGSLCRARIFSGLVVTDHLHPEYLSRIDTDHNWDHVIDHYLLATGPPRPGETNWGWM